MAGIRNETEVDVEYQSGLNEWLVLSSEWLAILVLQAPAMISARQGFSIN